MADIQNTAELCPSTCAEPPGPAQIIARRIRSRRGASISFALLLFLVCAVLSSVIVTAATAAAGRMSSAAETDQRYYAVISAAELLKGLLDGKTVSVVETVRAPSSGEEEKTVYLVDKPIHEVDAADCVPANQIREGIFTGPSVLKSIQGDAAYSLYYTPGASVEKTLSLTASSGSGGTGELTPLSVGVEETLDADGSIELRVYNRFDAKGEDSDVGNRYTLILDFQADTRTESSVEPISGAGGTGDGGTVTTTITGRTWNLTGIRTASAAD